MCDLIFSGAQTNTKNKHKRDVSKLFGSLFVPLTAQRVSRSSSCPVAMQSVAHQGIPHWRFLQTRLDNTD